MHQLSIYFAGLMLGLGLLLPLGPINLFVMRQGISLGRKKAWPTVLAIAINDSLMIAIGAVIGTAAISAFESLQAPLMLCGALYLTFLGGRYLRATRASLDPAAEPGRTLRQNILLTVGVVWLNPNALFDVFCVLGTAIGTRDEAARLAFVLGLISASWIWYAGLTLGADALRHRFTPKVALQFDRVTGLLLLMFAGFLWSDLVR